MPQIDFVKVYRARVQPALDPSEHLLALGPYGEPVVGDTSRLATTDAPGWTPAVDDRLIRGFRLVGGVQVNFDRIDRWLGGVSGVGGPDSIAARLWRIGDTVSWLHYAVTDQRLLLLSQPDGTVEKFRIRFATNRSTVVTARWVPKLLFGRGRVELTFSDGSMLAVLTGTLWPARARSLVAAFGPSAG